MDEQQNDQPEEQNEQPQDAAPDTPSPEPQASSDVGESKPEETPDAVKAAGNDPIGEGGAEQTTDTEGGDGESIDASSIKDPSMDFPEPPTTDVGSGAAVQSEAQAHPAEFPQFGNSTGAKVPRNINLLMDVNLPVSIELGRTSLPIGEILEWGQGSIIELDRLAGEPVDLMVNNKLVAKGEVVVVDEKFGLRITSLTSPRERLESL
ncbi:MAG: flagellar motor switch protein FliN [candidate division Zixibacteria bacterium]|nr:flagellar motor switch protein FliN [candidate division Zixibacteria bacterium]